MANTYEDGGLRARAHHFGSPLRNFVQMLAFGAVVSYICYLAWPTLIEAFLANIYINSVIVGVLALGVVYTLVQVLDVWGAVGWVKRYQSTSRVTDGLVERAPYAVKPMAELLRDTPSERRLSSVSARAILDSVGSRLSEAGEITRYFRQLLIFLGLFGTFFGLMQTLRGVVNVVNELAASVEGNGAIANLFAQLALPLEGMGVAFSSSILGIGGSLILGFLELQANQAQGRFYNDLEDWLAKISRVGIDMSEGGSGAFANALLEQEVAPPGPVDFIHDPSQEEFTRAEVNAYIEANVVRDYVLRYNPDFPVVANQTDFPLNVNVDGQCNAYYDGSSLTFFRSGGRCPNMAYGGVVHHEYGHHLVSVVGSGQIGRAHV